MPQRSSPSRAAGAPWVFAWGAALSALAGNAVVTALAGTILAGVALSGLGAFGGFELNRALVTGGMGFGIALALLPMVGGYYLHVVAKVQQRIARRSGLSHSGMKLVPPKLSGASHALCGVCTFGLLGLAVLPFGLVDARRFLSLDVTLGLVVWTWASCLILLIGVLYAVPRISAYLRGLFAIQGSLARQLAGKAGSLRRAPLPRTAHRAISATAIQFGVTLLFWAVYGFYSTAGFVSFANSTTFVGGLLFAGLAVMALIFMMAGLYLGSCLDLLHVQWCRLYEASQAHRAGATMPGGAVRTDRFQALGRILALFTAVAGIGILLVYGVSIVIGVLLLGGSARVVVGSALAIGVAPLVAGLGLIGLSRYVARQWRQLSKVAQNTESCLSAMDAPASAEPAENDASTPQTAPVS